jgi:hypothetical protein
VWCHHGLTIEAVLDRTLSATLVSTHRQRTALAWQEIRLADQCLDINSIDSSDPAEWTKIAGQAATLGDEVHRNIRPQAAIERRIAEMQQAQRHPGVENAATRPGPDLSLLPVRSGKQGPPRPRGSSAEPSICTRWHPAGKGARYPLRSTIRGRLT